MNIFLCGGQSPFGRYVAGAILAVHPDANVFSNSRTSVDPTCLDKLIIAMERVKPEYVIHCDVYGGDTATNHEVSDKLYQNLTSLLNTFEAASFVGAKKVVVYAPQIVYPENWTGPLLESELETLNTNGGINSIRQAFQLAQPIAISYRHQVGIDSLIVVANPTIGEHFLEDLSSSFIVDAIKMVYTAKVNHIQLLTLPWYAKARFELDVAQDVANILSRMMDQPFQGVYNVGIGRSYTGQELAEALKSASGFTGEFKYAVPPKNTTNPVDRYLDTTKLAAQGLDIKIPLDEGLRGMFSKLEKSSSNGRYVGIRLGVGPESLMLS